LEKLLCAESEKVSKKLLHLKSVRGPVVKYLVHFLKLFAALEKFRKMEENSL
jgi:hypothetical protein